MFFGFKKVIEKLSIYGSRHGINLQTFHGWNQCSNWLVNLNNPLLRPQMEGFEIELLPIIKRMSKSILDLT